MIPRFTLCKVTGKIVHLSDVFVCIISAVTDLHDSEVSYVDRHVISKCHIVATFAGRNTQIIV
jgi:hypothetical protein